MRREIKFRAYDKKNKRMFPVYGIANDFVTEDTLDGVDEGVNCFQGENLNNIEVMQYTSLKDKNGKEIYEGDIVKYIDNPTMVYSGNFEVIIDAGFIGINAMGLDLNLHEIEPHIWCEVIGNIHENPELL